VGAGARRGGGKRRARGWQPTNESIETCWWVQGPVVVVESNQRVVMTRWWWKKAGAWMATHQRVN
jgi:hypothetical protein